MQKIRTVACLALVALIPSLAAARSLEAIGLRGTLALCAHPNALPFASKKGDPPGFQVELGRALAEQLGVGLTQHWVINGFQYRRADCDIVLDAIADKAALAEVGLRLSRPYYRSGIALAVRADDATINDVSDLQSGMRVGVQVGSLAAMVLSRRGVETSPFMFEDELIEALTRRELAAAAVTATSAGYFNMMHPDKTVRLIRLDEAAPELGWNVAVGMMRPDDRLRERIDAALERLLSDGTIERIYAHYGVALRPPQ